MHTLDTIGRPLLSSPEVLDLSARWEALAKEQGLRLETFAPAFVSYAPPRSIKSGANRSGVTPRVYAERTVNALQQHANFDSNLGNDYVCAAPVQDMRGKYPVRQDEPPLKVGFYVGPLLTDAYPQRDTLLGEHDLTRKLLGVKEAERPSGIDVVLGSVVTRPGMEFDPRAFGVYANRQRKTRLPATVLLGPVQALTIRRQIFIG